MADLSWDAYRYRVASAAMVTPVIRELWFEPIGDALPYRAGQYALLADAEHRVPQRSYSIANAPRADGRLSMLVTLVPGGPTSTWAHGLSRYDEVSIEGPFGTFVAPPDSTAPVLLLGAGSGLAPVRALAESLLGVAAGASDSGDAAGPARGVTLYFSGRTAADAIDRARFEQWSRTMPQFSYVVSCTRDAAAPRHTRVPEQLAHDFETLSGTLVFTAGPPGFVTGCHAAALALGARPVDVHTEEFFTDPVPWSVAMPPLPGAATPQLGRQEAR